MRTPATVGMTGLTGLVLLLSWLSSQAPAPIPRHTATAAAGVVSAPRRPAVRTAAPVAPRRTPAPVRRTAAPVVRASFAPVVRATTRPPSPAPVRSKAPVAHDVVVNGSSVDTPYGPVQVQITLRSGRIVKADAIDYPRDSDRSQSINSQAVPQLDDETLQTQSAQIDTVSGASYTSDGYRTSLQSALDAAHRAGAR